MASNRPVHIDISGYGMLGDASYILDWHSLYASAAGTPRTFAAFLPLDQSVELISPLHAAAQTSAADAQAADPAPAALLAADLLLGASQPVDFLSTVEGPLGDSYWRPS